MLPADARLRCSRDFAQVMRRGRRAGRPALIVHLDDRGVGGASPQVGFAVGRAVGGAVVRNQVRRRLRHVTRSRLASLPPGSRVVVRALPAAATLSSAALARELDLALSRVGIQPDAVR